MKLAIATAPSRNSKHWKQGEIDWDDVVGWLATPDDKKESGNYLFGTLKPTQDNCNGKPCTNLHRNNAGLLTRSALTIDVDYPGPAFLEDFQLLSDFTYIVHTTYSSTPSNPRYRVIIPTDREMAPDEYHSAVVALCERYGSEQFDPASRKPAQYMFRPAAQDPSFFRSWHNDGPLLVVDDLLDEFVEDLSTLDMPRVNSTKRNPFEIDGVVGAFNRAYDDFQLLIDAYELPYEPDGDRWHLVGARSVAGMGKMADGLVFSHHSHDPAFGVACTAFDLVRLHRYGELDEGGPEKTPVNRRKSYTAMLDDASVDARVIAEIVGVDFSVDLDDGTPPPTDAWKVGLRLRPRTGEFLDCVHNWDLVSQNDPVFQLLYYNDMTMNVETSGDLPWRSVEQGSAAFTVFDRQALMMYLEREYGYRPTIGLTDVLVNTKALERWVNPVKDYLETLTWDGQPRVETCLPGVHPTSYTRMVARKSMVAAVARMFDPGVKWDHTLVLYGGEGLGKTWWINKVFRGYDSTLGKITDKDTLLIMHRSWIMLADEGHSLKKADVDVQKEFLTRTSDVFRMPYDRETVAHKRRFVFWSTTNDEIFLRRQEGNRRFLIVHSEEKVDFTGLTSDYIDQLWAEAVHLYQEGELLYLEEHESLLAKEERERFTEEDNLTGLTQEFLDTPVPDNWDWMSPDSRRQWMMEAADGFVKGTQRQEMTCSTQIWVEMMGNPIGRRDRAGLLEITNTLKRMPGWTMLQGRHRVPNYGPQVVFVRDDIF